MWAEHPPITPGPFEGQRLASRTLPPVSPIVCFRKRARIKKFRRPAANAIAAVVRTRLNDGDAQSGLDKPARDDRAGRPTPHDDYVADARSFDHPQFTAQNYLALVICSPLRLAKRTVSMAAPTAAFPDPQRPAGTWRG